MIYKYDAMMYEIRCVDTSLQVPVFVMFPRYSYAPYLWASVTAHGAGAPGIRPGEMEPTDHQSVLCGDPGAVPEEWVRFLQPWGPSDAQWMLPKDDRLNHQNWGFNMVSTSTGNN